MYTLEELNAQVHALKTTVERIETLQDTMASWAVQVEIFILTHRQLDVNN